MASPLSQRKAVGRQITKLRRDRGLSARALGQKAKVSGVHILRLESGEMSPTLDVLVKLSKALDAQLIVEIQPKEARKT